MTLIEKIKEKAILTIVGITVTGLIGFAKYSYNTGAKVDTIQEKVLALDKSTTEKITKIEGVANELQKKQDDLPKNYVSKNEFNRTINNYEKQLEELKKDQKNNFEKLDGKIEKVLDRLLK